MLIGDTLDAQVKAYVRVSQAKGCVVNTSLIIACGMGIVKKSNPDLLKDDFRRDNKEFLSKSWAKSLLGRMGYVKRRGTTTANYSQRGTTNCEKVAWRRYRV